MRLMQPDPAAALLGLRAMKTMAIAAGQIGPSQRALMEAAKRVILHIDADIDALPPITPAELAAGFPTPELRRQFVNGMLVVSLSDGVPARETASQVEAFAKALGVNAPELHDLHLLADNHMTLFKLDVLRRGQVADILKDQLAQKGPLSLARSVLTLRGVMEDKALAQRYRAWEKLPEDTLGYNLVAFYNKNGFSVPGERGGFPEFSVLIFSTGINVRPTADGFTTVGVLGKPGVAELMFAAIERGSKVNTDLSDKWDYWPLVELPIDEVRRRLNILPAG